ncbi:ATP-grasp domain-containing protein [Blastococcus sp. SYSU DS0973]
MPKPSSQGTAGQLSRPAVPWFVAVELDEPRGAARPEFGAGERLDDPGVALLDRAGRRGMRTAVLTRDRRRAADGTDWPVDRWVHCETADPAAMAAAVRSLGGEVAAVTSAVDGFAGPAAAAARALGLRGPTPGSAALGHDAAAVRTALAAAGATDVAWCEVAAGAVSTSPVGYPCVVQPVDAGAGCDVGRVSDDQELRALAGRHLARTSYGRGVRPRHRLLVEGHVPGRRYAADGFVDGRGPVVLAWSELIMAPPPHVTELALTVTTRAPGADAADHVGGWLAALGYDFGPFHLEFVLGPAGPRFAALHTRLAAAGPRGCVDQVSGVDTADLVVARLLGAPGPPAAPPVGAGALMHLAADAAGRVRAVSGVREAACIPGLLAAEVFADLGSSTAPPTCSREQLGHVVTVGETPEQARRRAVVALDRIRVEIEELLPA